MKTLDDIDLSIADALDEADGVADRGRWRDRERPVRHRMLAACIDTMPVKPTDNPKHLRGWKRKARKKCGSIIVSVLLSVFLKMIIEWLYERWKERSIESSAWSALQTEARLLLEREDD